LLLDTYFKADNYSFFHANLTGRDFITDGWIQCKSAVKWLKFVSGRMSSVRSDTKISLSCCYSSECAFPDKDKSGDKNAVFKRN